MYGKEIKEARKIHGSTQKQVSAATNLPQNTISWIELDKGIPNIQQCVLLANFYKCSLEELLGLSDTPQNENTSQLSPKGNNKQISFIKEFASIIDDDNYINMSKLYKNITPTLRALTLGYIVGLLQNNGVDTKEILGY